MASGKPTNKRFELNRHSNKVGQTLQDLEAAFADWDALSDAPAVPAPVVESKDIELRKKTKKLLDQLRQQLAELAD
jgi:hypothetical protein